MAPQPCAKLEEAGVVDHAVLLEAVGDLGEARALRNCHADRRAISIACERLVQGDQEPSDAEQDQRKNPEGDQTAGSAPPARGAALPRTPPTAAVAVAREPPGLGQPVGLMPIGCFRLGFSRGGWLGLAACLRHRRTRGCDRLGMQRLGASGRGHRGCLRRRLALASGSARLALQARGLPLLGRTAARYGRRASGAHSGVPARLRAR